jgi:HPt (histidine-containing phosphotransfer) domain-containing protein
MDDYVPKPVDLRALAEALQRVGDAAGEQGVGEPAAPVAAAEADPVVLDPALLARSREDLEDSFDEIVATVVDDVERGRRALVDCRAEGDMERAGREAHALKSVALLLGGTDLASHCQALESAAKQGEGLDSCAERFAACERASDAFLAAVEALR